MRPLRFILDNTQDAIQEVLSQGRFYEAEELQILKDLSKPGWTILDVGANIGNHTIYFDKYLDPKEIIVFEPLPQAYKMLLMNIALNYCHRVNLDYIGLALGDKTGSCNVTTVFENNLGGTRLTPQSQSGSIQMTAGDLILGDRTIHLIKMDIEGMELHALHGLKNTILRNKPLMYIEVDNQNESAFWNMMQEFGYQKFQTFVRYTTCKSHILVPN